MRYWFDERRSVEAIVASVVSGYGIPEAVVCGRGFDLDSVDSRRVADRLLLFCAFSQQSNVENRQPGKFTSWMRRGRALLQFVRY